MTGIFDYTKIRNEVEAYVTDSYINDYDIDEVMDELRGIVIVDADGDHPITSIDEIDIDEVLQRHDISGR